MTKTKGLKKLEKMIADFAHQRDWEQYHSPKNLAMALSVEVAELVEIFQWKTEKQSYDADKKNLKNIEDEIADIMIYLTLFASKFEIDLLSAAEKKIKKNRKRFPVN